MHVKEVFKWRKYHSKTSSSCVFYSADYKSAFTSCLDVHDNSVMHIKSSMMLTIYVLPPVCQSFITFCCILQGFFCGVLLIHCATCDNCLR